MTGALYAPLAQADMGGQLFVREIELKRTKTKLAAGDVPAFLRMPFDEAIKAFAERYGNNSAVMDIIRGYRNEAKDVSERTIQELANRVLAGLQQSLTDGVGMDAFLGNLEGTKLADESQSSYISTVFRTNIATAYGAGRVREIERSSDVVPYVQYRTCQDSRVRASHAELDGAVFKTSSDWQKIAPPLGYNCRCTIVTLEAEDVDGATVYDKVPQHFLDANEFAK